MKNTGPFASNPPAIASNASAGPRQSRSCSHTSMACRASTTKKHSAMSNITAAAKAPNTKNGSSSHPACDGARNPARRATRPSKATLPAAKATSTSRAVQSDTPNNHQLALTSQKISGDLSMYGWPLSVSPIASPDWRISHATVR